MEEARKNKSRGDVIEWRIQIDGVRPLQHFVESRRLRDIIGIQLVVPETDARFSISR